MSALYQIELAICTGMKPPRPNLPSVPHYEAAAIWPPRSEGEAHAEMERLAALNPGYKFCVVMAMVTKDE